MDPIYARLAKASQKMIQDDPDLNQHLFQQGMTFVCDGQPSRFTEGWKGHFEHAKSSTEPKYIVESLTREDVYQQIHGKDAQPPSMADLGRKPQWNKAYSNLEDAFIDAEASIQIYYDRCLKFPSINFKCGSPVDHIDIVEGNSIGVTLEDGLTITASLVIVAAGAWSHKLVYLGKRLSPIGHEVAWIKVTAEEEARWKNMSITTNESTGLNMFPPYRGEIKILRRSPGYKNTITVPHPEDRSQTLEICYPRTIVSNPTDVIPADAEASIRDNLREIMPTLANRPFDRTKICWSVALLIPHSLSSRLTFEMKNRISTTPTADFLIAPHPRIAGIHLATGGSAHAWKFLPMLGDFVVDSIEGTLLEELVDKWAFHKYSGGKDQNAPRMDGEPEELRDVVRTHL